METLLPLRDRNQGDPVPSAEHIANSAQTSNSDQNTSPDQNESCDLPPPPKAIYPSRDIARDRINEFAMQHGYSVSCSASHPKTSYIVCHRSGNKPSKSQGIRCRATQKTNCPFKARLVTIFEGHIEFTVDNPNHNHPAAAESTLVASRRFQIRMFQRLIKRLLDGHTNGQILEIIRRRIRHGECHLTIVDIKNFRASPRARDVTEPLHEEERMALNQRPPNPTPPLVRTPIWSRGTNTDTDKK